MDRTRPFKRLVIENHFSLAFERQILVYWFLSDAFDAPGPYTFVLQRGHAANDDSWVDVSTVVDQPWLYDNNVILAAFDGSTCYRVKLIDHNQVEYISQSIPVVTAWNHADWRRMKEITRKELLARRLAGTEGWLLKRRLFGAVCPCVNTNNDQIGNGACPVCYGTGLVGGYYPALRFDALGDPEKRLKRLTGDQGLITSVLKTSEFLAWPMPQQNDIWVAAYANKRYRIESDITITADWRGVPMKMNLRLTELPNTDVIYTFPTPIPAPVVTNRG